MSGQDRLSYDIFTLNRESALEELAFPDELLPIDQFSNIANSFAQLGSGTDAQPFATVKDYDDWLKRAALSPAIFDQAIANMREGVRKGIVQPRVLMEKVLPQLKANITDKYITALEAQDLYGCGASFTGNMTRWTDPLGNFCRDPNSGTQITIAKNINIPATAMISPACVPTSGTSGMANAVTMYTMAQAAIGFVSEDAYENIAIAISGGSAAGTFFSAQPGVEVRIRLAD